MLRKSDPLAREPIQIGRLQFGLSVATQFTPPKIISQNENDVGGSLAGGQFAGDRFCSDHFTGAYRIVCKDQQ